MLKNLFKPFTLGQLELTNRLVMAPMTRSQSPNHIPTEEASDYYAARASGGVGLIITEGTGINHPGTHGYPDVPNLFGEAALAGWQRVVEKVHLEGAKIFPQLWHVGSVRQQLSLTADGQLDFPGVGPSAISHPFVKSEAKPPHALSLDEVEELINAYAEAAEAAKSVGFDGIELHGAHGYLIDQFFWDKTNQRKDKYGGETLAERAQFAFDIVTAIKRTCGENFPISFRLSQWKLGDYSAKLASTTEELQSLVQPLAQAGVDIFHCSTRRFYEPEFPNSHLNLAGWVKKLSGKPSITVGSVGLDNDFVSTFFGEKTALVSEHLEQLASRLGNDEFDLVAVGRMLLANPDWVSLVQSGQLDKVIAFSQSEHAGMRR